MRDKNTPLTRTELLDLVWSTPITKITAEFDVPVSAVVMACEHLGVPRPAAGHWSAVKFGTAPTKPALPAPAPREPQSTTFGEWGRRYRKHTPRPSASTPVATTAIKQPAAVPPTLHKLATQTLAAYRNADTDRKRGVLFAKRGQAHLKLSVRPESLNRAVELLSHFITLLEQRGFAFVTNEKSPDFVQTVFSATGTHIEWSLHELTERFPRELKPEEKEHRWLYDQWHYRGTGRLRISLADYYPTGVCRSWGEGKNTKLETKLDEAAEGFSICAGVLHAQHLAHEERKRRWEEERRLSEEQDAWRRSQLAMQSDFYEASERWGKAESLRQFRSACEKALRSRTQTSSLSAFELRWLEWADRVADDLDPFKRDFLSRALRSGRICELSSAQLASVRESAARLGFQISDVELWIAKGASDSVGDTPKDLAESLAHIARYRSTFPDYPKFQRWLDTRSELLENHSPRQLIAEGRIRLVGKFVQDEQSDQ